MYYYLKANKIHGAKVMEGGYIKFKNKKISVCANLKDATKYPSRFAASRAQAMVRLVCKQDIDVGIGKYETKE